MRFTVRDTDYNPGTIYKALRLVGLGLTIAKVARRLEVPYHAVRSWLQRYEGLGQGEIKEAAKRFRPGRPQEDK